MKLFLKCSNVPVLCRFVKMKDIDVDELREALPSHQPRFLVYSCKLDHGDGRISYPMCFIFSTPRGHSLFFNGSSSSSLLSWLKKKCKQL
jgi:Cofilin/tropomyosin-type actin-binding protein